MNAIDCKNLNKSFGKKNVLNNVELQVEAGVFYGLVGMNGSGKSTMIKAMLDLVSINSGEIYLFGQSHRRVTSRNEIAYFPDRFNPPAHLTGRDFIKYMLELYQCQYSDEALNTMLDALELDRSTMRQSVSQFSKGMTQKLGLASCLLSGKKLLILDEPMSGLDPHARILVKQQLAAMKKKGVTLFFSSHVLVDVEEIADSMAVLHASRIMYTGSPGDFKKTFSAADIEEAYLRCIENKVAC